MVFRRSFRTWSVVCLVLLVLVALAARSAGRLLVVDQPGHADLIVVLAGDRGDTRFEHALELLRAGYAQDLILDAPDWVKYGRSDADYAAEFVRRAAPDRAGHVHVCQFTGDSTVQELSEIAPCLHRLAPAARTAIVVTSAYHTRRSLAVARQVLPQYAWTAGAAPDPDFNVTWWKKREWAKTTLTEWQKLLWWTLADQWKTH